MKADASDAAYAREGHLLRAGVAALVGAILLLVLLGGEEAQPPVEPPVTGRAGALSVQPPAPGPADATGPSEADVSASSVASVAEAAPVLAVAAGEEGRVAAALMPVVATDALVPAAEAGAPAQADVAKTPPPRAPAPALGPGYVVQLGVFAAPENAERLRDKLAAQDYPAHLQSRVVVGPYPDLKSAEAASARLRRAHRLDAVIVPPRKP